MSDTANPVQEAFDALGADRGIPTPGGLPFHPGVAFKRLPSGLAAQLVANVLDPAMAATQMELKGAIEALTSTEVQGNGKLDALHGVLVDLIGAVAALGPKVDAQTLAVGESKASTDALAKLLTGLGTKLDTLAAKEQATVDALATLNGYNATIATGALAGVNYAQDFATGASATLKPADAANDAKLLRVVVSAATLLGTVLGGGAKLYVYHCAGASDAYNASGAVLLGTYPVASNSSYAVLNGRAVPKGRYLRAQATNGGCAVSVDVA